MQKAILLLVGSMQNSCARYFTNILFLVESVVSPVPPVFAVFAPKTGRAKLRVRQGLGTRNEIEANRLVGQLNEILADQSL